MSDRQGIMLAKPYEERLIRRFKPPYIVQPKLNGLRCRAVPRPDGEGSMLLSSSAAQVVSVPHILDQINARSSVPVELDGEFYIHGESLDFLRSIVSRTKNLHENYEIMELHLFDVINDSQQMHRNQELQQIIKDMELPNIHIVPSHIVYYSEEITELLGMYLSQGYEGIVIRDAWATYERKKTFNILKLKPESDDFYLIVGYKEEVSIHGISKGRLGAVWCEDADGTRFKVGSGLNDEMRDFWWKNKEELINMICHVKYAYLNQNNRPIEAIVLNIITINEAEELVEKEQMEV